MLARALRPLIAFVLLCVAPTMSVAQNTDRTAGLGVRSPVLIIDYDSLFEQSRYGQRVRAEIEAEGRALIEENTRIQSELSAEELVLTSRRESLSPEEFRVLADAFDAKVQQLRDAQQVKAEAVGQGRDAEERRFRALVSPLIARLMQEAGAVVVIDRADSIVWVDQINITDRVLRLADQVLGDGTVAPDMSPDPQVPEDAPTGTTPQDTLEEGDPTASETAPLEPPAAADQGTGAAPADPSDP